MSNVETAVDQKINLSTVNQNRIRYMMRDLKIPLTTSTNDFIKENWQDILAYIPTSKYVTSTKRDYLILVQKLMKDLDMIEQSKIVNKEAIKFIREFNDKETDNTLTSKSELTNWTDHDTLLKAVDVLRRQYLSKKSLLSFYQYLVLGIYVLQPPLRYNYHDMQLVYSIDDMDEDLGINYLLINKNKLIIYLNNDKVQKVYGQGRIQIINDQLVKDIRNSVKLFPRSYLFTDLNDTRQPMKRSSFIWLLEHSIPGQKISVDLLRSSYITWFYSNDYSIKDKDTLAKMMRHSRQTAEISYNKIINIDEHMNMRKAVKDVDDQENVNTDDTDDTDHTDDTELSSEDKKLLRVRKLEKNNYHKNSFENARKKYIYYINKNNKQPTKRLIDKYSLKHVNGKWEFE